MNVILSINIFTFYQNHPDYRSTYWTEKIAQKIKSPKINCDEISEFRFHRKYIVIIKNAHERATGQHDACGLIIYVTNE